MQKVELRSANIGDEKTLAYIQVESWKAAFSEILSPEKLTYYTNLEKAEQMYKRVLTKSSIHIVIEDVNQKPHCIAAWSQNRGGSSPGCAELICIHSLQNQWHRGYGSMMMRYLLAEMGKAGYTEVILWVFKENKRSRAFYEKHGFSLTGQMKNDFGPIEIMYHRFL